MLRQSKHGRNYAVKRAPVAAPPLPDRHDPVRACYVDVENVLLEAGHRRAVALLRAAGRGPTRYVIDRHRVRVVVAP